MKSRLLRGAVAGVLACAALSAQAMTLSLTGWANGYQTVSVGSPTINNQAAGAFQGTLSGSGGFDANPFVTYCVEITQDFSWGNPLAGYSIVAGNSYFSNASAVDRLGRLFTVLGGASLPGSSTQSAAIQLAVWESVYETGSLLNVTSGSGSFAASAAPSAVITAANTLLAQASALSQSLYSISVLTNADRQDFVLVQRVPEPATLALVGVALAAGFGAAKRRSQRPQR